MGPRCLALALLFAGTGAGAARASEPTGPYMLHGPIVRGEGALFTSWVERARRAGARRLEVSINSEGGDVEEAFTIRRALLRSGLPSRCEARGVAASAAFLILQSCVERVAAGDARLATHQPYARVSGPLSPDRARWMAQRLGELTNAWDRAIAERLGMPLAAYRRRVENGQTWLMDADSALRARALDRIIDRAPPDIAHNIDRAPPDVASAELPSIAEAFARLGWSISVSIVVGTSAR